MSTLEFVNAHADEWSETALNLTRDYFDWMDKEIQKTCSFSISDVVGLPLDQYIITAAKEVCPVDQSDAKYYLLVDGKCAVAMGGLRVLPGGDAEVVRIYTKPEHRGRGIARMMLRRLISDATQSGFKTLKLDTGVFMKDAQSLYLSHGFKFCSAYDGAEPPAALLPYWLFMERNLEPSGC